MRKIFFVNLILMLLIELEKRLTKKIELNNILYNSIISILKKLLFDYIKQKKAVMASTDTISKKPSETSKAINEKETKVDGKGDIVYGWMSEKQMMVAGVWTYETTEGKIVNVTQISKEKCDISELGGWDDYEYIGELKNDVLYYSEPTYHFINKNYLYEHPPRTK